MLSFDVEHPLSYVFNKFSLIVRVRSGKLRRGELDRSAWKCGDGGEDICEDNKIRAKLDRVATFSGSSFATASCFPIDPAAAVQPPLPRPQCDVSQACA